MNKSQFLIVAFLCFLSATASGQGPFGRNDDPLKPFHKSFRYPRGLPECQSSFVSVLIPVKNDHIDSSFAFSEGCPEILQRALRESLLLLDADLLRKELKVAKTVKAYQVLLPVIFYSLPNCQEQLSSEEYARRLMEGLNLKAKGPLYLLEPVQVGRGKSVTKAG